MIWFYMDFGLNRPLIAGCFAGLVMVILLEFLWNSWCYVRVDGTWEYPILVVFSLPDFMPACPQLTMVLVTFWGKGVEFGIGLAVPVGRLLGTIRCIRLFRKHILSTSRRSLY